MWRRMLLIAGCLLALGLSFGVGLLGGLIIGETDAYHRRFLEEQRAIAPLLAGDPAYAGVELHEYSAGGLWLGGDVPTAEDLNRLQDGIVRAVAKRRAEEAMRGVNVRQ